MARTPKLLDAAKLYEYALRTLSGRAHSLGELREKLRRKAEHAQDIDPVLLKLKEAGYLNDRKFAEGFTASRLQNQGHGRMRVLRDLRQKRVAPKLAEQVTQEAFRDTDEAELVEAYLARHYRSKNLPVFLAEEKNLASAFRRLRYAGFSPGTSIRVLKKFSAQADELESMDQTESEDCG
ncbi:MAG: RecX family transcriptional regulator [Acidobacteriaceae bacterium]|nr:RecX family transcriptional regulator [Acidobacteriaceae bacterium]